VPDEVDHALKLAVAVIDVDRCEPYHGTGVGRRGCGTSAARQEMRRCNHEVDCCDKKCDRGPGWLCSGGEDEEARKGQRRELQAKVHA
jgi:hypothetical protein